MSGCGGEGELDAVHACRHHGPELEQFEADRSRRGVSHPGASQTDAPHRLDQGIGQGGEPQPQMVGSQVRGRGAVCLEIELALLDTFSISPRAQ